MSLGPPRGDRRGFTLIEVLVTFSIVGVLITLLLPAVNSCREAARRNACINNLAQLAIALQGYQNVHEVLPPGVVNATGPIRNIPRGYHHGWLIQLLPFLEQDALASRFDDSVSLYAAANHTVRTMGIAVLLCPSDGGPRTRADGAALGSYAACHNDVEAPIGARNVGSFFLNSRVGYEDIPDGTSQTIFLGETRRFPIDLGWASGTRATLRNAGIPLNSPDLLYGQAPITSWADDETTSIEGTTIQPDPTNPNLVGGFNSAHPGGVSFAFGDGSVRFLPSGTSTRFLRRLANRSDGEILEEY
jgi:prepilin-type N-terminal cleavage/methylation domain-containing protein/prepilin-type processing-associated H-X9-DG protein